MNYLNEIVLETPIGNLCVLGKNGKIVRISFTDKPFSDSKVVKKLSGMMRKAVEEIEEYFGGERKKFDFDFAFLNGTNFQISVWKATERIQYGKVKSYADIAREIGRPKAYRAVANALGANPLVIVVPCHRIISQSGIGGFTSGVWRKKWLLGHEKNTHELEEDML